MEEEAAVYNGEDIEQQNHKDDQKLAVKTSFHAKLPQLLRDLASLEFKIHSEASKEFVKLLRAESGGDLLHHYVQSSKDSCSELLDAWKSRLNKPGGPYMLSLISVILSHDDGMYKKKDFVRIGVSRKLDDLANNIVENRLEDVYNEIKSKDVKRVNAALGVVTAIVRRGGRFAMKVVNSFDFKLPGLAKLAEFPRKDGSRKSTRSSFVEFAMSFLEIGNPKLITRVLHLRDIYFGVLRELGRDDEENVVYVLSTLRDRVLTPESLVTPALRSVLFGSVTLEQLISISGNPDGGISAKVAHEVLVMVCTDPCNGLMPDVDVKGHTNQLKGNPRRLLDLMKKLRATEITYHRDLLLDIVKGRLSIGSAYMSEFPYPLEPRASSTWFSAISLASELVSSTSTNFNFGLLFSQYQDPPSLESAEMQCMLKCIIPRAFSRIIMTRGLLHSDFGVRHGSMRLLLEALKALDSLIDAIDCQISLKNLISQKWMALKQKFVDEARALLPDSQVLYKLISTFSHADPKPRSLKRSRESESLPEVLLNHGGKKLKSDLVSEDVDLVISGITPESYMATGISNQREATGTFTTELEKEEDCEKMIVDIWGLQNSNVPGDELKDAEVYFHSKLLDALTLYLRTMPMVLDGSFDFFKILPSNPFTLSIFQQQSLLSLLIEYIKYAPSSKSFATRDSDNMYKHLHPLLDLLIYSPVEGIRNRAYILVRAALLSTGLFDRNCQEIDVWLLFLPGYRRDKSSIGSLAVEVFKDWSKVVSFLCDVVSTAANSLYKYMDHLRCLVSSCEGFAEVSPNFGPLFICTLRKCLRLLDSDTGTFKLHEKTIVSLYVCNTLNLILQTQVNGRLFSSLIDLILTERFGDSSGCADSVIPLSCEWRPLKNLLLFSRSIFHPKSDSEEILCQGKSSKNSLLLSQSAAYLKGGGSSCSIPEKSSSATCHSLDKTLRKTKRIIKSASDSLVEVARAFCSSIVCASPDEILEKFPAVITVSSRLLGADLCFLASVFSHDVNLIGRVANLWPDVFLSSLDLVVVVGSTDSSTIFPPEGFVFDSVESAAVAFSSFLKQLSFHVLFPAIMGVSNSVLLGSTKLIDFLHDKLSEGSVDDSVVFLRLILFWAHQIQSSYRLEPLDELEQLSGICFILVKGMLERHLVLQSNFSKKKTSTVTACIQEIAETIFHHPAVTMSLSNPLCCNKHIANGSVARSLVDHLSLSDSSIHPFSHEITHLLITVADHLLELGNDQNSANEVVNRRSVKAFMILLQQVILMFRDKFKMAINRKNFIDLIPSYHVIRRLICIIPPFMVLELVDYIFECCDSVSRKSVKVATFSIGCDLASGAFDLLSCYLHEPNRKTIRFSLFMEEEQKSFYVTLVEKIYLRVLCCAIDFKMDCADSCLLKAVKIVYKQKFVPPQTTLYPSSIIAISRVITNSPIKLLSHCIQGTTATKAKLLFLLTEVSPLHLTFFGTIFSCIGNKDQSLKQNSEESFTYACTDEQLMMLLPVALSYLELEYVKLGVPFLKHFQSITSIYSKILLDGFLNYRSYTSGDIFQGEYDEMSLSSAEALSNAFRDSLLGKAISVLQYHFSLNVNSLKKKKRVNLFNSLCPCSGVNDNFLDIDVNDINVCSFRESVNFINRILAKITFCRMLLLPTDYLVKPLLMVEDEHPEEIMSKVVFHDESLMMRFTGVLISTLHKLVKRFPLVIDDCSRSSDCSHLFSCLEMFILRNICEVSLKIRNDVLLVSDDTIIEQFARSSFLYRFEDPTTLKVLCCVLLAQGEGKSSCSVIFELLLSHSKFLASLLRSSSTPYSSDLLTTGILMRPMSSVLKSYFLLGADQSEADNKIVSDTPPSSVQKLAVIKLLRVLYHYKATQGSTIPGEEARMNSKELLCLLMSCYGASLSEIDLEIYDLMNEIISSEASEIVNFAELDYLWGSSALKLREKKLENNFLCDGTNDCEKVEECRRQQFRENLVLDSKTCAATIISFPYDRLSSIRPLSLKNLKEDVFMDFSETSSTRSEKIQVYDPAFILRFSIYSLSMSYLDPLEFVGLGLLAIAFMSISSPDEGIRKLGYETLGRLKNALESGGKRKDGLQLQLLLTSLQNGIVEPWQKIPSFTAIFAAEASFILLDPKRDHYDAVTNLLEHSKSGFNLKCIPLFHQMFGSISVNSKACRLWILQLSYAGLNSEDDARILINMHIAEFLLSFYTSSLSDYQAKTLILQIIKKCMKLPMIACYLVQKCNLISWLSSVLSSFSQRLLQDDKSLSLTPVTIVLEVAVAAISLGSICKWLKENALEQLSELSSNALKLLIGVSKMKKQNLLDNLLLQLLVSTLRISQERDSGQPHFTISYDGLFQLYESIEDGSNNKRPADSVVLGLKAILTSTPPAVGPNMDLKKLLRMTMWVISTASVSHCKESNTSFPNLNGEVCKDSLILKLLRWLTASIILGRITWKSCNMKVFFSAERFKIQTLQTLLEHLRKLDGEVEDREVSEKEFSNSEALAARVMYLQQLIGMHHKVLPSVISAVCLSLLSSPSTNKGKCLIDGDQLDSVMSLCSKIQCPAEANPAWRWGYDEPWIDNSSELTDLQRLEQQQACEALLVIFAEALRGNSSSQLLSYQQVEESGVFMWERNIVVSQLPS